MTGCDGILRLDRPVHDIGTNVEHGCLLILFPEEFVKGIVRAVGSIVEAYEAGQTLPTSR